MDILEILAKKLAYEVSTVETVEASCITDLTAIALPSTGEKAITMYLTSDEWQELYTCIFNISPYLYPDRYQQIVNNFILPVVCNVLCTDVLNSFNENPDCLLALTDLLNGLGFGQGGGNTGEVIPTIASENLNLNDDCTDDGTYGVAYEIVSQMNTVVVDWLDIISSVADALELVSELIDAVPVFGSALTVAYDVAVFLFNEIISAYNTAWNTATHDAIACEVWQFLCDDCQISLDDLQKAYRQVVPVVNIPADNADWLAWANWYKDLVVTSDVEIVGAMHLMILTAWRMGSAWASSSQRQLQIATQQADPLSPPMGCDCNSVWCYDFDFRTSDHSTYWTITGTTAVWVSGEGYKNNGTNPNIYANLYNPDGNILIYAEIEYTISGADQVNKAKLQARSGFNKGGSDTILCTSGANGELTLNFNGSQQAKSVVSNPQGTVTIHRILLQGRGTSPFPSSNC